MRADDTKAISEKLAGNVSSLLDKLGLKGERKGHEFVALNPTRNDSRLGSFKINTDTGLWIDNATRDSGDALALVAYLKTSGDTGAALRWSRDFLGLPDEKPSKRKANGRADEPRPGLRLAAFAEAKGLDVVVLKSLGVAERADTRGAYVAFNYINAEGAHVATRQRWALDGDDKFRWRSGDKPCLYAPDGMKLARARGYVVIVEGESDTLTLLQHDIPAVGVPGAGNWKETRDAPLLEGIEKVFVVHEGDTGGDAMLGWLAKSDVRHRAYVVHFEKPIKDPNALYLASRDGFRDAMRAKLDTATSWRVIEETRASEEEKAAYEQCRDLANAPDILARFREGLASAGLVGEDRNAQVLYLALTSRLLDKIVSAAYRGVSSAGKSYTVECVLKHFPEAAFIRITGMSERALIWMEEDFAHRHLVIAEADGASGEMKDYLLRTLLSEERIEYRVVEKTSEGLRERKIEKAGPCGLVLTTTRVRLHVENETRLISLNANESREQTRAVLNVVAALGNSAANVAPSWQALQTWLGFGERRVVVPYAITLASLMADNAVRVRRDFRQVLSLVKAHALLHRQTRERDAQGRIVATLADYGGVHGLVSDLLAEGIAATVPPDVRETVNAVATIAASSGTASNQAVAKAIGVDKSVASRRCAKARELGYVVNEETHKGREARYRIAEPMPDDMPVMPLAETLAVQIERGGGASVTPHATLQLCNGYSNEGVARLRGCEGGKNTPTHLAHDYDGCSDA